MRKVLLLVLLCVSACSGAFAAAGDTTWIQSHNGTQLSWYGDYDDSVGFPDGTKSYSKILMTFTLGKYVCLGSPQYCADWDYTVQNFLMTRTGDTVELGRLITPYANGAGQPANWTFDYVYDVTDFYPLLKDSAVIRTHYSGYSGGFTAVVKFAFIEGTRPRNVLAIKNIYSGSFRYGSSSDPIENHLPPVSESAPAGVVNSVFKLNISGHGIDTITGCSEFCKKYYQILLNGNLIEQRDMWRDDCGYNEIYPQNGTWVYERANWCPGNKVNTMEHMLSGVSGGANYTINLDMQPSIESSPVPIYIIEGMVFYYGATNQTVDVGLEDIIAPTSSNRYYRENPIATRPTVKIKNYGSTDVTSVKLQYGANGAVHEYTWTGTLKQQQDTIITIPAIDSSVKYATGTANTYKVAIAAVNGTDDANKHNDTLTSTFSAAPVWDATVIVAFKTNSATVNGVSETEWKILDEHGVMYAQRINNAPNTYYYDTITLGASAFKFVMTDAGCNGSSWWAAPNDGTGSLTIRSLKSAFLNYTPRAYYGGDFGCGFTQEFTTRWPTGVEEVAKAPTANMELIPNPASDNVTISIEGLAKVAGVVYVTDITGRRLIAQQCTTATLRLDVAALANGVYSISFVSTNGDNLKIQSKLVIAR